ncbi:MAG: Anti-sigma-factor antagonist [uncultured bacterium]|nr:MAG: Anti-sigma-factor antagonist [uncultured bacterium]
MEISNKILILDNEKMVLETIEMFYPSDDVSLFTASSLETGIDIISKENPPVIVTNIKLKETSGFNLIDRLRKASKEIEIVAMADIDQFKDVLAEFGKEISDVVYKPIDMDILEIIIKRAQTRYVLKKQIEKMNEDHNVIKDENNNLNSRIMDLNSQIENLNKEQSNLKEQIEAGKISASGESSLQLEIVGKQLNQEKQLNTSQKNFGVALINAFRKSISKPRFADIFSSFEECISKSLNVKSCKINPLDANNQAKLKDYQEIIKNNKLQLETSSGIEIPFRAGEYLYIININEKIDINPYMHLFYILKDILELLSLQILFQKDFSSQLEKEKAKTSSVCTILANIQMYIKKSEAVEKIKSTKEDLMRTSNEILDLIFNAQDHINKLDSDTKSKINCVNDNLNKIIDDKSQHFDIISQKLAQVTELVNNIQAGLEGKRMQQISGDQYLFSKDRKQI